MFGSFEEGSKVLSRGFKEHASTDEPSNILLRAHLQHRFGAQGLRVSGFRV